MDTEYVLGCALELSEVTAVENAVLSSERGGYWPVRHMVDNDLDMPPHFLHNTARSVLARSAGAERHALVLGAVPALSFSLKAFEQLACHLVQTQVQQDLGVREPRPALLDRVSPLGARLGALRGFVQGPQDVTEARVRALLEHTCSDLARRWGEDLGLLQDALHWYHAAPADEVRQALAGRSERLEDGAGLAKALLERRQREERARRRQLRARLQDAKAAIKKATRLFENLGQRENLQMVVSGREVTLMHPSSPFKYVVKPPEVSGWLVDRTQEGRSHTPYEVQWLTRDDVHLARLCVYFKDTPVLDQLLAMTLYVHSGEELQLLQQANWFATDGWSETKSELVRSTYPALEDKLPRRKASEAGLSLLHGAFQAEQAHWEPYRGRVEQWVRTWLEPARRALDEMAAPLAPVERAFEQLRELALLESRDLAPALSAH